MANFAIRQALFEELARQSLSNALWALAGTVGMLFSTFRALAVLARGAPQIEVSSLGQTHTESRMQIGLILGGIASLLLIGIFPQVFLQMFNGLLTAYPQLP